MLQAALGLLQPLLLKRLGGVQLLSMALQYLSLRLFGLARLLHLGRSSCGSRPAHIGAASGEHHQQRQRVELFLFASSTKAHTRRMAVPAAPAQATTPHDILRRP